MGGDDYQLAAVKFSRLPKHGLLLGLSGAQLACLGVGVACLVAGLYTAGGAGVVVSAVAWPAAVLGLVRIAGRPLIGWMPVAIAWVVRQRQGKAIHRRTFMAPQPAGSIDLPGHTVLRQYDDPVTGAVMVHDPVGQTLTAVVEVTHPAFVLLDPADQDRRVRAWGRVLAGCCRSGRIARIQVSERTLPDTGSGLSDWWSRHGHDDGSWTARVYQDLIRRAGPASERHSTTISIALDLRSAHKAIRGAGGGIRGAAAVLRQEMTTLTTALRSADLAPGSWLDAKRLAVIVRTAYDPQAAHTLDQNPGIGRGLESAGPVAVDESWDGVRTDSAWHAVLWVSEWPRTLVYPGFLAPVLLACGVRRSFSLSCAPIRADHAARDIRRKKTEHLADMAQRAKIGQIQDAAQTAEYKDVLRQEADLASGHGVIRHTALIAVTADSRDELQSAVAAIEQAAIQASCETRLLVGQQAQAFTVAALPLCLVV